MDINAITLNECANDGKTIYLYFNNAVGFYTAYGFSAFLVAHVVDPICSFSTEMQMPVALVNHEQIHELRRSLNKLSHMEQTFYKFALRTAIGIDGYAKWTNALKNRA